MQDKFLFEYAVIRVVPRVDREEFLNAGVIMYCKDLSFLKARISPDRDKLASFGIHEEIAEIETNLEAFCKICNGTDDSGPIGKLGLGERFRWLTAMRSTVVQTSRVHPGFCTDAGATLDKLHREMVL